MPRRFPVRNAAHQLEEQSERFFHAHLPNNWTYEKQIHDYGVDLRVDIFEGVNATGLELVVQLKGSAKTTGGATETVRLRTATYNYLRAKLQLAMLVKFVAEENEAYWLLVRDIPEPNGHRETFSVYIPRGNRLSTIDWNAIEERVNAVTSTKLAAMRRQEIVERRVR